MNKTLELDGIEIFNVTLGGYLDFLGNLEYIDIGYLYLLSLIAIIGTILNVKCMIVFRTKEFLTMDLFYFYRTISINNAIHCFIGFFHLNLNNLTGFLYNCHLLI